MEKGDQHENDSSDGDEVRATVIRSNSREQETIIEDIIYELRQKISIELLVEACLKSPRIREEPELIQKIFEFPEILYQMSTWILNPLEAMKKTNTRYEQLIKYPKILNDFVRENQNFYEFLYINGLNNKVSLDIWLQFLQEPKQETFLTAVGYFMEMFLPFIRYEFSSTSQVSDFLNSSRTKDAPSVITLFSEKSLKKLIEHSNQKSIFEFLYNLALVALQDNEWKISLFVLSELFKEAIAIQMQEGKDSVQIEMKVLKDEHAQQICKMVHEISQNIEKDKNNTVFAFIENIIRTDLLLACRNRIINSRLCLLQVEQSPKRQSEKLLFDSEEDTVEYCLKILSETVKIYYKLRKIDIDPVALNMKCLQKEVELTSESMTILIAIAKSSQNKSLSLSMGSMIKPITLVKYAFFQLLLNLLTLSRDYPTTNNLLNSPTINVEKLQIFELIKRYLLENKWNNILHATLEKISSILITNQFVKSSKNYVTDKFLPFLIENFASKKYIFLDSSRFTTLGNNYTLYKICKKVANELEKKCNKFPELISDYKSWTNFVINNLQVYEEKMNTMKYPLSEEECSTFDKRQNAALDVEVDELISVKELVKNINDVNKWTSKEKNQPKMHGSGIFKSGSSTDLLNANNFATANSGIKKRQNLLDDNNEPNFFKNDEIVKEFTFKNIESSRQLDSGELRNKYAISTKTFNLASIKQVISSENIEQKVEKKQTDKEEFRL